MNNLKKYAGLLNDIAPKGEFLAYINEDEAEMLKDNGALGLLTNNHLAAPGSSFQIFSLTAVPSCLMYTNQQRKG